MQIHLVSKSSSCTMYGRPYREATPRASTAAASQKLAIKIKDHAKQYQEQQQCSSSSSSSCSSSTDVLQGKVCSPVLTCQVVDALLAFLHVGNVGIQTNLLAPRLAGLKTYQLGQALPVLDVLDDAQLDCLAELFPEGGILLRVFCCLSISFCRQETAMLGVSSYCSCFSSGV